MSKIEKQSTFSKSVLFFSPSQEDAFAFANQVGYPCLLRPSYVLR